MATGSPTSTVSARSSAGPAEVDDLLGGAWGCGSGEGGQAFLLLSPPAWDTSAPRLPASWRSPRFMGCSDGVPRGFPAAAPPKEAWVVSPGLPHPTVPS